MSQLDAALPPEELLERQAQRLGGLRSRLLRRARIAHRAQVLDLGAGYGAVTEELARRCGGNVIAADRSPVALAALQARFEASGPLSAQSTGGQISVVAAVDDVLPIADGSVDLVFAQYVFLWNPNSEALLHEVRRVLTPGGVVVAIEPDFGGMIESPPAVAVAPIWHAALRRAGAEPEAARQLIVALKSCGFEVELVQLADVEPPDADRFAMLAGLPLTREERAHVEGARTADRSLRGFERFVHLPVFGVVGGCGAG